MIIMISAAMPMAIAVPRGPAFPRKVFPGITNAPHPMMQPRANDHTFKGESFFSSLTSLSIMTTDLRF